MIDYLIWPWFERAEAWQLKWYDSLFIQEHNKQTENIKEHYVYLNQSRFMLHSSAGGNLNMNTHSFFLSCLDGNAELDNWILRMQDDPAVKALMFSTDDHKAFFTSFMCGNPNYDHGL